MQILNESLKIRWRAIYIMLFIWYLFSGFFSEIYAAPMAEYKVKAAFFLKFADFVDWPVELLGNASSPIRVGVVGFDPFKKLLPAEISPVDEDGSFYFKVTRLSSKDELIDKFDILYFSYESIKDFVSVREKIKNCPILTVGEGDSFIKKGGMITFTLENNRVRFSANLNSFKKANLSIRAQLLELAKKVLK